MMVATFRNSMGVFQKGWIRPAVTVSLNFIFSYILVVKFGLIGTLIGTLIARTLTLVWYDPYIIFKQCFDEIPFKYYCRYLIYSFMTAVVCVINLFLNSLLPFNNNFFSLLIHGGCYFCVSVILLIIFGTLFKEQKEVLIRFKRLLLKK